MALRLKPAGPAGHLPRLILMTDVVRLPDPEPAIAGLPRGAAVIVRHPTSAGRRALAHRLSAPCRRAGVKLLVSADARLAHEIGADGMHLPEALVGVPGIRRRPGWLVTAAAHSPAALRRAAAAGADAALLSPVFATKSHAQARPIGALRFAAWVRAAPLPVYALGGVGPDTAQRLVNSGACGFAGIEAVAKEGRSRTR